MLSISELIGRAKTDGYTEETAQAKVCQDIVLFLIAKSSLNRNVTIKGGVVMRSISGNARRATLDIDLDFIKYSLRDDAIIAFIDKLNALDIVTITAEGAIEELRQQDYHGKRIHITITDKNGDSLSSKIDLGVHNHYQIEQEEYCFDVGLDDEGASLLINSKEQMVAEKLRSLLVFGPFSTRYKDVFDIYYLSRLVDRKKLTETLEYMIFADSGLKENSIADIIRRVEATFSNRRYRQNLSTSKKNWLGTDVDDVLSGILAFLISLCD
ncbi:MAG: nucleotidyl transferase AbiEii/AbiGii toxin family protein [Clostridia bacterium]|nr:nucleotidyl transferase AbiEii/AbiGii toxin family protein [Clostridia bacterium]